MISFYFYSISFKLTSSRWFYPLHPLKSTAWTDTSIIYKEFGRLQRRTTRRSRPGSGTGSKTSIVQAAGCIWIWSLFCPSYFHPPPPPTPFCVCVPLCVCVGGWGGGSFPFLFMVVKSSARAGTASTDWFLLKHAQDKKLFSEHRATQLNAVKSMQKFVNHEAQYQLVSIMLNQLFKVCTLHYVLMNSTGCTVMSVNSLSIFCRR